MNKCLLLLSVFGLLLLSACSSDDSGNSITGVSPDDANQLNAAHQRFESSEDPPITAQTHFAAAQFAESQDAFDKAIEQYNSAIKLDPKHRASLYSLAMLHTRLKQYAPAIATWKLYIDATGGQAQGYSNLGYCCELAGKPQDAEQAYLQGISADGKNQACRVNYGLMLARRGRTNEAIVQLQAVLSPSEVHYNLGSVYELQGKREQARAEYRKAVELDENATAAKSRLAALE
jgi:tetratricopeptide (TPR) repeat protein